MTFVFADANNGDDQIGTGTRDRPVRSLTAALRRCGSGDTIVLREGHYAGPLPGWPRLASIEGFGGEQVWIDGAEGQQ